MNRFFLLAAFSAAFLFTGCEAPIVLQSSQDRQAISTAIAGEAPGNYFVGRRFYKVDYKLWGARNAIGSDNNYEYRLSGYFSGEKVYEPASDTFYPEFVLTGTSVISTNPALIFPDQRWIDPAIRLLGPPQY